MQKNYSAVQGQSNADVCLQTYGTMDYIIKLLQDSGIDNINAKPKSQQQFKYNDTLVFNQGVASQFLLNDTIYATDAGPNGSVYYIIEQPVPPTTIKPPVSIPEQPNNDTMLTSVEQTQFTSSVDGTTVIGLTDKDGNSMAGANVVSVEVEIKPLKTTEFVWNKTLSQLTLVNGAVADSGQTVFVLFTRVIS